MLEDKRKKEKEKRRRKEKARKEDDHLCQKFKEKKKNITSLVDTRTKLMEIQTTKKMKQETLADLSEQVESVAARNRQSSVKRLTIWMLWRSSIKKLRE
ncbi:hypothetical protein E5676_scaffold609G001440 [Cucumis melo var. makuwa]|uniref:Uncharacterized protein n=1 Tax=Cucumis melo var. makuwa TaxID=1194695 RepID=A0A5D3DD16_CUCMM|nr:hypothetical protein E6C27_scaffold60G001720 [Cucumis melo var. makuwa]TYK21466.1 hypothetical protein E5676_scaffold609G001440 [Cucumis melo var. makuwa]